MFGVTGTGFTGDIEIGDSTSSFAGSSVNGAVMAEWLNVTLGYDFDILWQLSREHIMEKGYAYVGVTAQRVGIYATPNGLQAWSPQRYAQLAMPQGTALESSFVFDPAAYAIYGQALKIIRHPAAVDVMGGLRVQRLIATGASQSAGALTLYYDLYQLVDQWADGFMPILLSVSSLLAAAAQGPWQLAAALTLIRIFASV